MASIRSGIGEFQSTLPREERLFHNCFEHVFNYFNPRSHERSDTMPTPIKLSRSHISIHAPTRGATPADTAEFHSRLSLFQSTLPREERLLQNTFFTLLILFQSTLPREERPICHSYNQQTIKISIHAPTRGATFSFASASGSVRFQSTLPREERRKILRLFCRNMPFQSTLPREERLNT